MAIIKKVSLVVLFVTLGIIANPFIKKRSTHRKKESIKKLKERWCTKVNDTVHDLIDAHMNFLQQEKKSDSNLQLWLLKVQKALLCHLEGCLRQEKDGYFGSATRESLQKSIAKIDQLNDQIDKFNNSNLLKELKEFYTYLQTL